VKVVFISDYFRKELLDTMIHHELTAGAESNDSVLISYLKNNFSLIIKRSSDCDLPFMRKHKDSVFIISNFIFLPEVVKGFLINEAKYIIYEHDHKYVYTRDPSKFKDYDIPTNMLANVEFYTNAYKVIVLSKICKEILEKNLNLNNVISIGTSLWSDEKFKLLEKKIKNKKDKKLGIIKSTNLIKGTQEAIDYCNNKNIEFELIEQNQESEFLDLISEYEQILFLPQVLETFCRTVAEAKILNCKLLTTPKRIGFFSESELLSLHGLGLLEELKDRTQKACTLFKHLIEDKQKEITVILNCYRRPEYLKEQIEAVKKQAKKPHEIWVWVNHHEDNQNFDFSKLGVDRIFKNDYNWKYYGRFAAAMLAKTKYIALFDDDTIPGKEWFSNCLEQISQKEGIMGGAGVTLKHESYKDHDRHGWSSQNEDLVEVDLVGHAWFFKKEWLKYLWMEDPLTWENGEDIHFAYVAQKYGNISSYCPPHPKSNIEKHSSLKGYEYGVDDKASSAVKNHAIFYQERDEIVKHAIAGGWKILKNK